MTHVRAAWLAVASALVACSTPPLTIYYQVADGASAQSCGTARCDEVPMPCQSVLHLRVLSPDAPDAPHISVCEPVPVVKDLCAISRIDLPVVEMPRETLEVQITVWPAEAIPLGDDGKLNCRATPVEFDAVDGFPVGSPGPALGGRAFYQPGDEETVVTLGCTNLDLVNAPTCAGNNTLPVTATVADFELLPFSVSPMDADLLNVFVGEPQPRVIGSETVFELTPTNAHALDRIASASPPAWGAEVDLQLQSSACVQVREDAPQSTTVVRCDRLPSPLTQLDIRGVRITRESLTQILSALGLAAFPEAGLTIGIVLDNNGNPASGYTVTATQGTVEYLNAARTGLSTGTKTTASGMFVSRDAPYNTFFDAMLTVPLGQQIGGRIEGKLTFVLFEQPGIGN